MAPLQWQNVPQKQSPDRTSLQSMIAASGKGSLGFIIGLLSGAAVSFLLIGLIVGHIFANVYSR